MNTLRMRASQATASFVGPLLVLAAAGCQTAPVRTIPEPLPETLDWAYGESAGGGFLGLKTRENDGGSLDELSFEPGVRVVGVIEQSPAADAGFQIGDIVLAYDGQRVDDPRALEVLVDESVGEGPRNVEVQRGDTVFEVPVEVRPANRAAEARPEVLYRLDPARSAASWAAGRGGVVLVSSHRKGPFPSAGVEVGSVVLSIDERAMNSDRGLIRYLGTKEPGDTVDVEYLAVGDEGRTSTASVRLLHAPRRVTRFKVPILWNYSSDPEGTKASFTLVNLWLIWLYRYERDGQEQSWSILRYFRFNRGIGELRS